jgi:hypothetical protein
MVTYNHAYSIAFEVYSQHESGDDVTPGMLYDALMRRIRSLGDLEWLEACGMPYDTHEEDDHATVQVYF